MKSLLARQLAILVRSVLIGTALPAILGVAHAAPVIYTDEASYLAALATLPGSTIHESFENDTVWADSRNSIVEPGRTPTVTSQGIVWTSNYAENEIATGTVGGDAPDGVYAIYSLPHGLTTDSGIFCDSAEDPDIPAVCYQNDGLKVEAEAGEALFAFGGRIDTANSGKVTFLLDGVDVNGNDTDNIDNWQREGDFADHWAFVGVIDADGFISAELRELRGKDFDQVLLFTDDFTIQKAAVAALRGDYNHNGVVDAADYTVWRDTLGQAGADVAADGDESGVVDAGDYDVWKLQFGVGGVSNAAAQHTSVPEPGGRLLVLLASGLAGLRGCRKLL